MLVVGCLPFGWYENEESFGCVFRWKMFGLRDLCNSIFGMQHALEERQRELISLSWKIVNGIYFHTSSHAFDVHTDAAVSFEIHSFFRCFCLLLPLPQSLSYAPYVHLQKHSITHYFIKTKLMQSTGFKIIYLWHGFVVVIRIFIFIFAKCESDSTFSIRPSKMLMCKSK